MASHRRLSEKRLPFSRAEVYAILESAKTKTVISLAAQRAADEERGDAAKRHSPRTNRGVNRPDTAARLVLEDGKVLEIPARRGYGDSAAFVDWVNFTVNESAFQTRKAGFTDAEVLAECSMVLHGILGFGITESMHRKLNFYDCGYILGDCLGTVSHGGNGGGVLVQIGGEGCAAALPGWEKRLFDFLEKSHAKLTRIDCAFDDYAGGMTVDDLSFLHDWNLFKPIGSGGRPPMCEMRGDWKNPNGAGRTFYVGTRESGKFFRGYEKGRQLGDKDSEWVRMELEFKSVNRELPYDMLLKPGAYLAAAYPALGHLDVQQCRIATTQKATEIKYLAGIENMKHQCGAWLWTIANVEGVERAFALLARPVVPKRLDIPSISMGGIPIHAQERPRLSDDAAMGIPFEKKPSRYGVAVDDSEALSRYIAHQSNRSS